MKPLSEFMREVSEECGIEHYVSTMDIAQVVIAATRGTISDWVRHKETMSGACREAVRDSWEENDYPDSSANYWVSTPHEYRVWGELMLRNDASAHYKHQLARDAARMWIDAVISILVVEGDDVEA